MEKSKVLSKNYILAILMICSQLMIAQINSFQRRIEVVDSTNFNRVREMPVALEIKNNEIYIGGSMVVANVNDSQDLMMVRVDASGNVLNSSLLATSARELGQSMTIHPNGDSIVIAGMSRHSNRNVPTIWVYNLSSQNFETNEELFQFDNNSMIRDIATHRNGDSLITTGSIHHGTHGMQSFHFGTIPNSLNASNYKSLQPDNVRNRMYGNSIAQSSSRNESYIVGYVVGNGNDGFYCKLDSNNQVIDYSTYRIQGANTNCKIIFRSITPILDSSQFIAVGSTDNCNGSSGLGDRDAIVMRLDSSGNVLFSQVIGTSNADELFVVKPSLQSKTKFYLFGSTIHANGYGGEDVFLASYNLPSPYIQEGVELNNIRLFGDSGDDRPIGVSDMMKVTTNSVGNDLVLFSAAVDFNTNNQDILLVGTTMDADLSNDCEIVVGFDTLIHQIDMTIDNVDFINPNPHASANLNLHNSSVSAIDLCPLTCTISDTSGCNNGSLFVSVMGGAPAYTYNWSTGQTTPSIHNVAFGNYSVTITDSNGDTTSCSYNLIGNPLIVTQSQTDANCGQCDGTISLSVSNGVAPYQYQLIGGASNSTGNFSGLCPGLHKILVSDSNNCRTQVEIVINAVTACWQQTTQMNFSSDWGNDIETDFQGNVYGVGTYTEMTEFECNGNIIPINMGNGNTGMYLTKYDPCGDPLWVAYTTNANNAEFATANTITIDEDNGILFVAGEYDGQFLDFVDGTGMTHNVTNYSRGQMYCAAYDMNNGAMIWLVDLWFIPGVTATDFKPTGICHNTSDVFVVGYSDFGAADLSWFIKVDASSGSTQYEDIYADKNCYFEDIEIQASGDLVVVGKFIGDIGSSIGIAPYPITSGSSGTLYDGFVSGISDIGTSSSQNWVYTLNATGGHGELYDVTIDGDDIYTIGTIENQTSNSFVHSGSTSVSVPSPFGKKAVVARLMASGNYGTNSWLTYSDPSNEMEGKGIDLFGDDLVMNGNISIPGSVQFYYANSSGTAGLLNGVMGNANSPNALWIAQTGLFTSFQSIATTDGGGNQNAEAISTNGTFAYSIGDYTFDINVTPFPIDGGIPFNQKAFFLRNVVTIPGVPFQRNKEQEETLSQIDAKEHQLFRAYPNPMNNQLNIEIINAGMFDLEMLDLNGKTIFQENRLEGEYTHTLDLSSYAKGVYLLRMVNAEEVKTLKIIKQ